MAICKIIPIGQNSGAKGVGDCLDYITDENKVISIETGPNSPIPSPVKIAAETEEKIISPLDFRTVLAYMQNDEKTHRADNIQKKYISGYLCNPETAVDEFLDAKAQNLEKQQKTLEDETGNWAYHIIQSFPEGLDISDDEVHQCGRELCEKLGLYQAVICSHVHPVINEEGEVSGKCKHNHILINSHIHPSKIDPEKPDVFKYNNCRETYAELQKWNDEISLEHGLPIIRNPELNKTYSWYKTKQENENASWTRQVAIDIKNTMRFCSNWEEFKKQMVEQGYFIRETGKTITYYSPEHTETHKQQIRENRLGQEYTKKELEKYWASKEKIKEMPQYGKNKDSQVNLIKELVKQYDVNLLAEVETKNKYKTYTLDIPLKNPRRVLSEETLQTYFKENKQYNLCTFDHVPLAQVSGRDIYDYFEFLRKEREKKLKKTEFQPDQKEYYFDATKVSFETNKPYRVRLWDTNGRRRTMVELLCILAIVVIKNEHSDINNPAAAMAYKGSDGKFIYAKTDWKIQNMYNTIAMANDLNVESAADVEKKLDKVGKEVARLRKQVKHLSGMQNEMQTIYDNLIAMESVKEICDYIYNMPEGEEKQAAELAHAEELNQYKNAKRYLHTKGINTDTEIAKFKERYHSTTEHLQDVQQTLANMNQEYRSLKKIEYNLTLAQNNYYCYGPSHEMFENEKPDQETTQTRDNTEK